jgi:hypothetical protein
MVTRQTVMENPGKVMLEMLHVLNFFTYHGLMIFTSARAVFSSHKSEVLLYKYRKAFLLTL